MKKSKTEKYKNKKQQKWHFLLKSVCKQNGIFERKIILVKHFFSKKPN